MGIDKQPNTNDPEKSGGDLSLEELFKMFPDEKTAMEWFESNIWPMAASAPGAGTSMLV